MSDAAGGGRSALVLGATGLVGSACVDALLADAAYERVRVLTRRPYPRSHPKLEAHVVDFDRLEERPELFRAQDVYCCLGTTIRAAGSREAFRRVDLDYVVTAARTAAETGAEQLLVVTALGADPGSRIFYNRIKGEMERAVRALPFRAVWVLRPSLLLGERATPRRGERIAEAISRPLRPLMLGPLRRWRPIDARSVALAMVRLAESAGGGGVVESEEIEALASGPHPAGPHPGALTRRAETRHPLPRCGRGEYDGASMAQKSGSRCPLSRMRERVAALWPPGEGRLRAPRAPLCRSPPGAVRCARRPPARAVPRPRRPVPRPRHPIARALRALLVPLVLALSACRERGGRTELVVSAAASLAEVMRDAAEQYAREAPGVVVRNNFGASGTLEQQIRQGAGVDVFVSAGEEEMDALAASGLVERRGRREVARNDLVLVVPEGSRVSGLRDLARPAVERVAMGAPASVPAGRYARAALESLGLWPAVSPKVVYAADVRQALAYAERGEVDAALVYRTDALAGRRVRVVAAAPPSSHAPIVYPAAVVAASEHPAAARRYLDFLAGPRGAEVFRRHGFPVPRAGG